MQCFAAAAVVVAEPAACFAHPALLLLAVSYSASLPALADAAVPQ